MIELIIMFVLLFFITHKMEPFTNRTLYDPSTGHMSATGDFIPLKTVNGLKTQMGDIPYFTSTGYNGPDHNYNLLGTNELNSNKTEINFYNMRNNNNPKYILKNDLSKCNIEKINELLHNQKFRIVHKKTGKDLYFSHEYDVNPIYSSNNFNNGDFIAGEFRQPEKPLWKLTIVNDNNNRCVVYISTYSKGHVPSYYLNADSEMYISLSIFRGIRNQQWFLEFLEDGKSVAIRSVNNGNYLAENGGNGTVYLKQIMDTTTMDTNDRNKNDEDILWSLI